MRTHTMTSARLVGAWSSEWQEYLALTRHDFFHTPDYHVLSTPPGGEAWMGIYGDYDKYVAWPYILQPIDESCDSGVSRLRDVTSVYGYSGPLLHNCENDKSFIASAWAALGDLWRSQSAVSVFTRFHPILENHRGFVAQPKQSQDDADTTGVYQDGKTVAIDLLRPADDIWRSYKPSLRQALRRLEREGVTAVHDPEWSYFDDFIRIYYRTMERNRAAQFYFFPEAYFRQLKELLGGHGSLMIARHRDMTTAGVLLIEYGGIVTSYLCAAADLYYGISPTKLLMHSTQLWAGSRRNRIVQFGGGRGGRSDDTLFRFKALFSGTHLPFYTGRWILDPCAYDFLRERRRMQAESMGTGLATYFPIYRAPFLGTEQVSEDVQCGDDRNEV